MACKECEHIPISVRSYWGAPKARDIKRRDRRIIALRDAGLRYQEIAMLYGITVQRVREIVMKFHRVRRFGPDVGQAMDISR